MSELDKRLEELLKPALHYCTKFPCKKCDASDRVVENIKQVLRDAGYIPYLPYSEVPDDQKPQQPDWWSHTPIIMTGREWFYRFEKEYDQLNNGAKNLVVLQAAMKAAGIETHE